MTRIKRITVQVDIDIEDNYNESETKKIALAVEFDPNMYLENKNTIDHLDAILTSVRHKSQEVILNA